MNVVSLVGRLAKEIDLRYTPSGTAYARTSLAVQRKMKNEKTGEYETDFIRLMLWGKYAEIFEKYTKKGVRIAVQGRMQTGSYENSKGDMVYTTDVIVESFDFLEKVEQQATSRSEDTSDFRIEDDDLPF